MKIKKYSLLYYIVIFILTLKLILENSRLIIMPEQVGNILNIISVVFLIIKLYNQKYTICELWIYFSFGLICTLVSFISKEYVIALSYLLIIGKKNVNMKNALRINCYTKFIAIFLHMLIYIINVEMGLTDIIYYTSSGNPRYDFYLGHPNATAGIIFWTIAELIYINDNKLSFGKFILCSVLGFISINLTNSRTSILSYIVLLTLLLLSKIKGRNINRFIKFNSKYIFSILSVLSISISYFYIPLNNIVNLDILDNLLSRRLSLGYLGIQKFGIPIFPQLIDSSYIVKWHTYHMQIVLDNIYIKSAVCYGVLFLTLISILFIYTTKYTSKTEWIYIIVFAIVGFSENYILNALISFPLLFIGNSIINNARIDDIEFKLDKYKVK